MVRSVKGQAGGRVRRRWDEAEPKQTGALIKRWIGATRRREIRANRDPSNGGGAQIITLTWEQTFGRPSRAVAGEAARGDGQEPAREAVILRPRSCA